MQSRLRRTATQNKFTLQLTEKCHPSSGPAQPSSRHHHQTEAGASFFGTELDDNDEIAPPRAQQDVEKRSKTETRSKTIAYYGTCSPTRCSPTRCSVPFGPKRANSPTSNTPRCSLCYPETTSPPHTTTHLLSTVRTTVIDTHHRPLNVYHGLGCGGDVRKQPRPHGAEDGGTEKTRLPLFGDLQGYPAHICVRLQKIKK